MGRAVLGFRKVRLTTSDYVWLDPASVRSVSYLDGQVIVETELQSYANAVEDGARSPEEILADLEGRG